MKIKEQIHVQASRQVVYGRYKNITAWPEWDPGVKSANLADGLNLGSKGTLIPKKGPKSRIEITEATDATSFTTSTKLPLCSLKFVHLLEQENSGTLVTHEVEFSGPFSPLFSRLIGPQIRKDLPGSLEGLKRNCEGLDD